MKFSLPDKRVLKKRPVQIGIVVGIVAIVLVLVGIGGGTPGIATFRTEQGEFIVDIEEKGELKAAQSVSVGVPRRVYGSTRITRIIEDGTMVKEGDFLVQFDTSEFENRVVERQNSLENAQAELKSLNASVESRMKEMENNLIIQQYEYEKAKLRYEQMEYEAKARQREMELDFKKSELTLQQAKEKIESQKVIDEANVSKAELKVKQAENKLKEAQDMMDSLTLKAPKSGMAVLQKIWGPNGEEKVKVGSTPWRGMDIVNIPDLSVMQVKTQVNEVDISRVKVGQQAIITLDAIEGPAFYGTLTNVAKLARTERGSETKIFDIDITIDGNDERLKPGMSATCKIITDNINDVISVPLEAVFEKEDTTVVYVKNGNFNRREVKVGSKNSDYIIIESGLAPGEEVALRDPTLPLEELGIEGDSEGGNGSNGSSLPL